MDKRIIMLSLTVGSVIGSYIPALWGDTSSFGVAGVLCGALGGFAGIWFGYRIQQ